jgi:hypothetical protein
MDPLLFRFPPHFSDREKVGVRERLDRRYGEVFGIERRYR